MSVAARAGEVWLVLVGLGMVSAGGSVELDQSPRLWSASAGAGPALLSEGGAGVGLMFDAFVRPWGQSGIGARVDGACAGAQLLAEGAYYENLLVTLGYAYQWPIARSGLNGSSIDFVFGPSFGTSRREWAEGLCLDFGGDVGCASSRPESFEPYHRQVTAVGGAISPNLHLWHVVIGVYASGAAGLAGGHGFFQLQAGVRLGASDM